MFWLWITEGDGYIFLVFLLIIAFTLIRDHSISQRVMRCEWRVDGFHDKVQDVRAQATKVGDDLRRVTGSFDKIVDEELVNAATRIRDRVKPEEDSDS